MEMNTGTAVGPSRRVLSVARDESVLDTCCAALRLAGFAVESTISDTEAVRIVQTSSIDVVVLGDSIPLEKRNALARAIRRVKADVPIIMLVLSDEPPSPDADDCMESLNGPEVLIAKLRKALGARSGCP